MRPPQALNAQPPSSPHRQAAPYNIASAATTASPADLGVDPQVYAAALTELNIARKNLAIYPASHHQVQRSLEKAQGALGRLLKTVDNVSIGVAGVHLMVGQEVLDPSNPAFAELATALKQYHVVMLRISAGLTQAELARFLGKLGFSPEEGGAAQATLTDRCPHIDVKFLDTRQFNLTREARIARPDARAGYARSSDGGDIWRDFTSQLLCGLDSRSDAAALVQSTQQIPPETLAELLNQHQPDADTVSQGYEHIIAAHMDQIGGTPGDNEAAAAVLDNLNCLIRELKPQLQRQFLSAAYQYCAGPDTPPWVAQFLGGLSEEFVVDMIRQANDKGEEISPSLINLVQKIVSTIDDDVIAAIGGHQQAGEPVRPEAAPEDPTLKTLFDREDYETFVIEEYDQVLKGLSDLSGAADAVEERQFPLAEHLETMEEPHLNRQIARVLLAFMNSTANAEVYGDYATKLMRLVPPLLNQGAFDLVEKIYFAFERHQKQRRRPAKAQIAAQCRHRFSVTPLLEKSITAFQRCSERHPKPSIGFFRMLGPVVVPYAMALLVKAPQDEPVDSLVRLLKLHPGEVHKAVVKHLKNANPKEVANIVRLMHLAEANHLSKTLKPLLEHPDHAMRRQVLEGLVQLKEPWAMVHLRDWLKGSPEEAAAAIEIAGAHRTMELVPDLCHQLVRAYFRRSTVRRNIDIIVALGKIGDPYALPILDKVAHSIWPLYPRLRREIKRVVYQSLEGYPCQSCRPLVGFGLKSKNAHIRRICLELLRSQQV
jgi:hypothetical protein